jgi:DNA-3-methyladenine glycosylase II
MARKKSPSTDPYTQAQHHLAAVDPVLARLITSVGPCTLKPQRDGFLLLTRAIVSQMISTRAAETISARIATAAGEAGVTPSALLAMPEETLRGAGLSRAKTQAIRELAANVHEGRLDLSGFDGLSDEDVMARLVTLRGIGRWTAEMYLIFGLGRLDVLPVGDLGLRAGVQQHYALEEMPGAAALRERAEPWKPYRSVATWYFWRSKGPVPQSS